MFYRLLFTCVFSLLTCGTGHTQLLSVEQLSRFKGQVRFKEVVAFYEHNHGQAVWLGREKLQQDLLGLIQQARASGLNEADYNNSTLDRWKSENASLQPIDSIEAEYHLTDAALHFFWELKAGNKPPLLGYSGLKFPDVWPSLISELHEHLSAGTLHKLFLEVQPQTAAYKSLLQTLNQFQDIVSQPHFEDAKIISSLVDSSNRALCRRLYQLGFADTIPSSASREALLTMVKAAQLQFDLLNDGKLRTTTLEALNIPLAHRIRELQIAVNILRWVEVLKQNSRLLVLNIPAANFFVYEDGRMLLDSRAVVGKRSTPTPTLSSVINEVILYPYWNVPYKIATKELLPLIQKNVAFLKAGNFQVLNKEGRVMNPYQINWHTLNPAYFPYVIRQSTGCDNALGLVKFNFYNPFTVYLHDTPSKFFFSSTRRFYSHGCMRVEKAVELAHLLLGNNHIAIDTLTAKGCLYQQAPIVVKAEKPWPLVVLYSTAWFTKDGAVRFYGDVYNKSK